MLKNPIVAIVFRVVVLLTAVFAVICLVSVISLGVTETGNDEAMYEALSLASDVYVFMTVGVVASLVLSVLSQSFCSKVSLAARTFFILVCTVLALVAFKANSIVAMACDIINEYDSLDFVTAEDLNITAEEFDAISNFSDNQAMIYMIAIMVISVVFVVLGITSIHYLVKKKNKVQA